MPARSKTTKVSRGADGETTITRTSGPDGMGGAGDGGSKKKTAVSQTNGVKPKMKRRSKTPRQQAEAHRLADGRARRMIKKIRRTASHDIRLAPMMRIIRHAMNENDGDGMRVQAGVYRDVLFRVEDLIKHIMHMGMGSKLLAGGSRVSPTFMLHDLVTGLAVVNNGRADRMFTGLVDRELAMVTTNNPRPAAGLISEQDAAEIREAFGIPEGGARIRVPGGARTPLRRPAGLGANGMPVRRASAASTPTAAAAASTVASASVASVAGAGVGAGVGDEESGSDESYDASGDEATYAAQIGADAPAAASMTARAMKFFSG